MSDLTILVSKKKVICPECKGEGKVREYDALEEWALVVCPLCCGSMIVMETITAKYEKNVETRQ